MKKALILIDIQNDYFPGGSMPLAGMEEAADNASKVLKFFRETEQQIFFVQHIASKPEAGFFIKNTPGANIHSCVAPLDEEEVITKNHPSCFRGTTLDQQLKQQGIEELVVAGAMSHMCIDTSIRAAVDLGYKCTLIHDGCATKDLEFGKEKIKARQVHAAYMASLSGTFATVVATAAYLNLD